MPSFAVNFRTVLDNKAYLVLVAVFFAALQSKSNLLTFRKACTRSLNPTSQREYLINEPSLYAQRIFLDQISGRCMINSRTRYSRVTHKTQQRQECVRVQIRAK